jgi:hypothetical protein
MTGGLRSTAMRVAGASVAPFAILVAPFAIFVRYQQYGFARREVAIVLAVFAAIALLAGACAHLSRKAETLALAAFLTFVADIELADHGLKRLFLLFVALSVVLWIIRRHAAKIVSLTMATPADAALPVRVR